MHDETILSEKFPPEFQKGLKSFLFKAMRKVAPLMKSYVQDQFTGTSKMQDFDWRLDFKVSSKSQERMKQPVLYVKMELDQNNQQVGQAAEQDVIFEVSKGQLKGLIDSFEVINQQLSGLAETMGGQAAEEQQIEEK